MRNVSEHLAVVGTIDPDAYAAAAYLTDAIELKLHRRILFIILLGDIVSTGTVDFAVHGATSAGGSYTAIPGTAVTQLTQAGSDSDKQVLVEVSVEAIENLGLGYTHVKGSLTLGTAGADIGVVALADGTRYSPAADYDLATVDEIVTLVN